jgi:hypothetical protein
LTIFTSPSYKYVEFSLFKVSTKHYLWFNIGFGAGIFQLSQTTFPSFSRSRMNRFFKSLFDKLCDSHITIKYQVSFSVTNVTIFIIAFTLWIYFVVFVSSTSLCTTGI